MVSRIRGGEGVTPEGPVREAVRWRSSIVPRMWAFQEPVQAHLRDTVASVPHHCNEVSRNLFAFNL